MIKIYIQYVKRGCVHLEVSCLPKFDTCVSCNNSVFFFFYSKITISARLINMCVFLKCKATESEAQLPPLSATAGSVDFISF